ncbi:MAG: hypothetical protein RIC56_17185 [Pseudomonadales bacterium]
MLAMSTSLIAATGEDTSQEKICESYRQNYDKEQAQIDRMDDEPYKANRQQQLDEKRARLEERCRASDTFTAQDEQAPEAPATDPIAGTGAPPLSGGISTTTLEGGIQETDRAPLPALKPLTPILDPRGKGTAGNESNSTGDVSGTVLPGSKPQPTSKPAQTGSGRASDSSRTTATVSGKIIGSGGDSDTPGGDTGKAVDQANDEIQGQPEQGGTVNHPITRSYFFAQGFLNGVMEGAGEASGSVARAQVGLYYLLTGRAKQAADIMGFKDRDSAIKEMQKDIEGWKTATTTSNDPFSAYENGRFEGRQLGKFFVGKYAGEATSLPPAIEQP